MQLLSDKWRPAISILKVLTDAQLFSIVHLTHLVFARLLVSVSSGHKAHGSSFGEPRWEPQVGFARHMIKWMVSGRAVTRSQSPETGMRHASTRRRRYGRPIRPTIYSESATAIPNPQFAHFAESLPCITSIY